MWPIWTPFGHIIKAPISYCRSTCSFMLAAFTTVTKWNQLDVNQQMNGQGTVHIHDRILSSHNEQGNYDVFQGNGWNGKIYYIR